jgi:hypothetical protein
MTKEETWGMKKIKGNIMIIFLGNGWIVRGSSIRRSRRGTVKLRSHYRRTSSK